MATPHNLSFHSVLPPDQSLQTPDTSSLLLPTSNQGANKNLSESSFQSLEELLNISGISNIDDHKSMLTNSIDLTSPLKRPLTENDQATGTKRPRLDETMLSVSAGQTQPHGHIPSILSHSKSSTMSLKPHSNQTQIQSSISNATGTAGTSVVFPLVNPATFGSITPNTQTNISPPVHPVSTVTNQKSSESTNTHATVDVTNLTSLLNQQSPIAIGSISLLVQLYKHHQIQGNVQGMQKIKEQLLTLQTRLNSKDQSVLTPLSSSLSIQNNLAGTQTNKPILLSTSLSSLATSSFSSSAVASHVTTGLVTNSGITLSRGSSTNTIAIPNIKVPTGPLSTSSVPMATGLMSTSSVPTYTGPMSTSSVPIATGLMSTSSVPTYTGLMSTSSVPTYTGLMSTSSVPTYTGLISTSSVPKSSGLMSTSSVPKSTGLMSTSSVPKSTGLMSTSSVPKSTGLMSTSSVPKSTGLTSTTSITMATGLTSTTSTKPIFDGPSSSTVVHSNIPIQTFNISMGNSTGQVLPVNSISTISTQGSTSHVMSTSPSIVTHTPSSTASLNQLPLGLQVTPQTQANVLKAVYSYRLQQIQDFLASIPVSQRPTSTQELRELLIKNNVLAKALPADFLSQLQKIPENSQQTLLQESQQVLQGGTLPNGPVSLSLAMPTSVKSEIVQSTNIPTVAKETVPSSRSVPTSNAPTMKTPSQTTNQNVSLPGVTMETLRTLCRLPEADFVGIPMPAMLMTIVQFLRAHKWVGNSNELPLLLKQAQDAIAKNNLSNVTQQSSSVQITKLSSGVPSIPSQHVNKQTVQQSTSSPLTQYMASFGLKVSSANTPSQDIKLFNNSRGSIPFNKTQPQLTLTHTPSRPATRYQTKAYQELLEKERLTNLQKVLQSSEEARISFRFQSHVEKLNQQLISPEVERPFSSWQDLTLRLLPYHVYGEPKLPQGAMEKADAVYEGIAGVLLSRGQGLMSRYQQMMIREEEKSGNDSSSIVLNRLWLESEREKKMEEEAQQKQLEEISTVGPVNDPIMDIDPFLLDSDSCIDDPFLSQIWNGSSDGLQEHDFSMGIT